MKVATLEKFHLRWGNQDPGDPGVGKVREGKDFFSFKQGGGTDPGWHYGLYHNPMSTPLTTQTSHFANLKKLHCKQKHAKRIVHKKDKFEQERYF